MLFYQSVFKGSSSLVIAASGGEGGAASPLLPPSVLAGGGEGGAVAFGLSIAVVGRVDDFVRTFLLLKLTKALCRILRSRSHLQEKWFLMLQSNTDPPEKEEKAAFSTE